MTPDELAIRVRSEYAEMPGLSLTFAQACRLWQLDARLCESVLDRLVREQFLFRTAWGAYIMWPRDRKQAKATIRSGSRRDRVDRSKGMNPASPRAASVLLITPFPDEGEMYAQYLNTHGFTTTVCHDSQEALDHAMQTPPDVIVTRLRQQGHPGGIEIVDRLRAFDATRHVPIVMITTSISASDRAAAHTAGCDGYVLLPLGPDALVTELRRVLAKPRHSVVQRHAI